MSESSYNMAVWFEIPVSDLDAARRFYEESLAIAMNRVDEGPNPIVIFPGGDGSGVSGHLYEGKPAEKGSGNTIHLRTDDELEEVMKRIKVSGGEVVSPTVTIPAGTFFYALDPDGNSFGVFKNG